MVPNLLLKVNFNFKLQCYEIPQVKNGGPKNGNLSTSPKKISHAQAKRLAVTIVSHDTASWKTRTSALPGSYNGLGTQMTESEGWFGVPVKAILTVFFGAHFL